MIGFGRKLSSRCCKAKLESEEWSAVWKAYFLQKERVLSSDDWLERQLVQFHGKLAAIKRITSLKMISSYREELHDNPDRSLSFQQRQVLATKAKIQKHKIMDAMLKLRNLSANPP